MPELISYNRARPRAAVSALRHRARFFLTLAPPSDRAESDSRWLSRGFGARLPIRSRGGAGVRKTGEGEIYSKIYSSHLFQQLIDSVKHPSVPGSRVRAALLADSLARSAAPSNIFSLFF